MRRAVPLVLLLAACHAPESAKTNTPIDPVIAANCTSCHGADLVDQQRLTPAQWTKTLNKMIAWGSPLPPEDVPKLSERLAAASGPYVPNQIATTPVRDSEPSPNGNRQNGKALFATHCASCHGPNARGAIGVNLVDRPLENFAQTVRTGRQTMPAFPSLTESELTDLRAHLQSL